MKSNYLKLNKVIAVAICLLYSHSLLAQIDADVNISKIKENQSENGKYTPYIPDVKHPVTLFSNEFSVEFIRKRIKDESGINGSIYWSDYVSIYDGANAYVLGTSELYLPEDYDEPGQSDPNAFAAKNAAFICLIGIDNNGSIMNPTQINQFKQVAIDALDMLKDNDYNKVYGGSIWRSAIAE